MRFWLYGHVGIQVPLTLYLELGLVCWISTLSNELITAWRLSIYLSRVGILAVSIYRQSFSK